MANKNLTRAKDVKNDEFYTQYADIEKEMNAYLDYDPDVFRGKTILLPCDDPEWSNFTRYFAQNFQRFGIRKLISTSYAPQSKPGQFGHEPTELERSSERFDAEKSLARGKIFVLEEDANGDGKIDIGDLGWDYLAGDGDFRSDEVRALRDEADIIITNPPFSLFREYMKWIMEVGKEFSVIGNMNAVTYKDFFPTIKNNRVWFGSTISSGDREFRVPESYPLEAAGSRVDASGNKYIRVKGVRWFTNLEHGRLHQPLQLMTMADNLKFNKKMIGKVTYARYDNYDAIEVPFTNAIPEDYNGVMGVPISFLDKYCPSQFEIVGCDYDVKTGVLGHLADKDWAGKFDRGYIDGQRIYSRIFIRKIA